MQRRSFLQRAAAFLGLAATPILPKVLAEPEPELSIVTSGYCRVIEDNTEPEPEWTMTTSNIVTSSEGDVYFMRNGSLYRCLPDGSMLQRMS